MIEHEFLEFVIVGGTPQLAFNPQERLGAPSQSYRTALKLEAKCGQFLERRLVQLGSVPKTPSALILNDFDLCAAQLDILK